MNTTIERKTGAGLAATHIRDGNWSDRAQIVLEAAQAEYTILMRLTLGMPNSDSATPVADPK